MTFCEVRSIARDAFEKIRGDYPEYDSMFRMWFVWYATVRAILKNGEMRRGQKTFSEKDWQVVDNEDDQMAEHTHHVSRALRDLHTASLRLSQSALPEDQIQQDEQMTGR